MQLTNNSLATIIAWVSTCLLAGGVSTLFNSNARVLWLISGAFGLAAAVGLDIAARNRERLRIDKLKLIASNRIEREIGFENEDHVAISAIRMAVTQLLGQAPDGYHGATRRRTRERYPCNLDVELLVHQCFQEGDRRPGFYRSNARLTNLSDFGFELKHTKPLPRQRVQMTIWSEKREKQTMLGELLWSNPLANGSFLSGGRFLNALTDDVTPDAIDVDAVEAPLIGHE